MAAQLIYKWGHIEPNAGVSVLCWGYSDRRAVNYSAVVYTGSGPGVLFPQGHILIGQGETFRHVDGTVARKVYIRNLAPFESCSVDLLQMAEEF